MDHKFLYVWFGCRGRLAQQPAGVAMATLAEALQAKGWTARTPLGPFTKGDWELDFDASHWMIVSTRTNPRVFDVPVPDDYHLGWTVNLIEHLCRMEDERRRLRTALAAIRDASGTESAVHAATKALAECCHKWLVNVEIPEGKPGRVFCPICGRTARTEAEPNVAPECGGTN